MIINVLFFFLGAATTILLLYLSVRDTPKKTKDMNKLIDDIEKVGSIKYRFKQAQDIADVQLELLARVSRPNASASHSRYKNDIVGQLKDLERQKMDIFRSILADGVDPNLIMILNGEQTTVKMSEAVAMYDAENGEYKRPASPPKTDPINPRNGLKLIVDNGDKNDTSDPKVP